MISKSYWTADKQEFLSFPLLWHFIVQAVQQMGTSLNLICMRQPRTFYVLKKDPELNETALKYTKYQL
jgi:hypothetical protein